ncbi:MAG: hypothetical protein AAF268_13925, partial [Cyanobacteria bacterium P01_A01_bin.3]
MGNASILAAVTARAVPEIYRAPAGVLRAIADGEYATEVTSAPITVAMSESALPALVQQMLEPAFYPHAVQEPIQLLQTHISYVLLTGEFAYKVKKPMDFGFLDFTTLDKRQFFI